MKTNKVSASPLLSALIVLLTVTLGAMIFVIVTDDRPVTGNNPLMLAVGGIVLVAIIAMLLLRDARKRLAEQAEQNERNQAAILQLLDELADLAEGDLTVTSIGDRKLHRRDRRFDQLRNRPDARTGIEHQSRIGACCAGCRGNPTNRAQPRERIGQPGARNHCCVDRDQRDGGIDRSCIVERSRISSGCRTRGGYR